MIIQNYFDNLLIQSNADLRSALRKIHVHKLILLLCVNFDGRFFGVLNAADVNAYLMQDNSTLDAPVEDVCNHNSTFVIENKYQLVELKKLVRRYKYVPILNETHRIVAVAVSRTIRQYISIGNSIVDEDSPCYLIAELGNNHNGSLDLALKLIDRAKEAGADCAKFQMRDLESLYRNNGANSEQENLGSQYTLDLLHRFQLSPDDMFKAFDHCRNIGIEPLCTPWDERSVQLLEAYGVNAYKVASADLTNTPLLQSLSATHKPLICSTGMAREYEIRQAVAKLQHQGVLYALLHCNSTYPAPFKDVNLAYMDRLREIGACLVGYSGHERGISVPLAAVARGAKIIEKHFTLDRHMEGNDHKVSLLPSEFRTMVLGIREIEEAMGTSRERQMTQGEMMNRVTLAKSIFAKQDITKGTKITLGMLTVKSPGNGLQPNRLGELLGRTALRDLKEGDVFYPADVDSNAAQPRMYHFNSKWGFPVRHHDYRKLLDLSNPELLEFHLSYRDLDLHHADFFPQKIDRYLVVHAPELFYGDHTLDLTSPDVSYREHSINEMRRVIATAHELLSFTSTGQKLVGLITNVGGFTQDGFLDRDAKAKRIELLKDSLSSLQDETVEIWPQTMPPFPWHFGGQRYHNLFLKADDICAFCDEMRMRVCLDISHSKMTCTHFGHPFHDFLVKVLPHAAHIHIADAKGVDGEGVTIGCGDIDFTDFVSLKHKYAPDATWIPEIWQGHENNGEGFWNALNFLEKLSL